MKKNFVLLCILTFGCNSANSDEAKFRELADRAIQGDMHALIRIKQDFPERWAQMQKDGNKERADKEKQDQENKSKVSSLKELFGYDLSLELNDFKQKYSNKIENCKEQNRYRGQDSFPYFFCTSIDGEQFEFAGLDNKHTLRHFYKSFKRDDLLASTFHQKISDKTGLNLTYSKYDLDLRIPYYKGSLAVNYYEKKVGNEFVKFVNDAFYTSDESMEVLQKEWSQKKIEDLSNKSKDVEI